MRFLSLGNPPELLSGWGSKSTSAKMHDGWGVLGEPVQIFQRNLFRESWHMVHYTCDRCGQALADQRFIVTLEVLPAPGTGELTAEDLDADNLDHVAEMLDELSVNDAVAGTDPLIPHRKQYDLCAACRQAYVRDPLGRGPNRRFKFSGN